MKKLISRISNGFGNQMFMYASSYAIAKELGRELELDIVSGINDLKNKNIKKKFKHFEPKYELGIFNIQSKITSSKNNFDGLLKNLKRKILLFLDFFSKNKNFIIEHRNKNKITHYKKINKIFYRKDTIYIEGYFESEKYFKKYKNDLIKEFSLIKKINCIDEFENKIKNSNSVSFAVRADRYNEKMLDDIDQKNILDSEKFEKEQFNYILRSIDFFNDKISNPVFFLFSDNPNKVKELFKNINVIIIDRFLNNKIIEDYYLMSLCKHFAVSPTTFHFWPAWLAENENKICLRPKNMNASNNIDYWPESWIEI